MLPLAMILTGCNPFTVSARSTSPTAGRVAGLPKVAGPASGQSADQPRNSGVYWHEPRVVLTPCAGTNIGKQESN